MCKLDTTQAFSPEKLPDQIRFQIPLYQRPYTWKSEQITQLLEDLWTAQKTKYYIGILSVAPTSYDKDLYDLIDGQQRITTLILIGRALKEYWNVDNKKWSNFLAGRLHLVGRKKDQGFLDSYDSTGQPENSNFRIAVDTIEGFLVNKSKECSTEFKSFSQHVYEDTSFFLSIVPDGYGVIEKNQQFVRLNNRGRQLEKHEILKVKLLEKIKDKNEDYAIMWNEFSQLGCDENSGGENSGSEKPDRQITLKDLLKNTNFEPVKINPINERLYGPILTFEEFLLIGLKRFWEIEENKNKNAERLSLFSYDSAKLLNTFQADNPAIWGNGNAQSFFKFLSRQNALLKRFFIQRDSLDKYKFLKQAEQEMTESEWRQNLIVLQSFLYVSTSAHLWVKDAFDWLSKPADKEIDDVAFIKKLEEIDDVAFITELERIDNDNVNFKNMKVRLSENSSCKDPDLGCGTPHYWFYRLDYELWKNRNKVFGSIKIAGENAENIAQNFVFRHRDSVEHITAITDPVEPNQKVDNSFANLALITISQNSKLSNNLFNAKRELLTKWILNKILPSLKLLHVFSFEQWNDEKKKSHMGMIRSVLFPAFDNSSSTPAQDGDDANHLGRKITDV